METAINRKIIIILIEFLVLLKNHLYTKNLNISNNVYI